jgi:hypothetical protein
MAPAWAYEQNIAGIHLRTVLKRFGDLGDFIRLKVVKLQIKSSS